MNNAIRIVLSLGLLYGLATESGVFTTMFCLFVLMNIEFMIIIMKRISPIKAQIIKNRILANCERLKKAKFDREKCGWCNGTGAIGAGHGLVGCHLCDTCRGTGIDPVIEIDDWLASL